MSEIDAGAPFNMGSSAASLAQAAARAPTQRRTLSAEATAAAAEKFPPALSPVVVTGLVRVAEAMLVTAIGLAVYSFYVVPADGFVWYYPLGIIAIAAVSVIAFQTAGIYRIPAFRSRGSQFVRLFGAWSIIFMLATSVSFFFKLHDVVSRGWVLFFYLVGFAALVAFRLALGSLINRWTTEGRLTRRTVVVGGGELGEALVKEFHNAPESDVHIVGLFDDRNDGRSPEDVAGQRKLGTVDDLVEFARRTRVDLVLFSLPITAETRILEMLKKLWVLPVDIRLSAHINKLRFRPRSYSYLGGVPVLDVFDRPIADWDIVMKWIFDRFVGTIALIVLSPVLLFTAIAVKLDSRGPVLFRQKRYGFNNELIEIYKFRSMYVESSDATAATLVHQGRCARHARWPFHSQDQPR